MPIYEFYCSTCHMLYNFFSQRVDTETVPSCPKCDRPQLERRPARFATLKSSSTTDDDPLGQIDETRMEAVMDSMMGEMDHLDDSDDPKAMASFFRRFGEAAGIEAGPRMEEMLARLEAGEDPDQLEEDLGAGMEEDEDLDELFRLKKQLNDRSARRPGVDDHLYFL